MSEPVGTPEPEQPDPEASSDGDRSWRDDGAPVVDPDADRSIDAVLRRKSQLGEQP